MRSSHAIPSGLWGMNVHVPGQDIDHVSYLITSPRVNEYTMTDLSQGYTWFFSIVGALLGIAACGAFATYRLMSAR